MAKSNLGTKGFILSHTPVTVHQLEAEPMEEYCSLACSQAHIQLPLLYLSGQPSQGWNHPHWNVTSHIKDVYHLSSINMQTQGSGNMKEFKDMKEYSETVALGQDVAIMFMSPLQLGLLTQGTIKI